MDLSFFNCQGTFGSMTRSAVADNVDEFTHFGHDFVDKLCFMQRLPTLFNIARQRWTRLERHCSLNTASSIPEENWWIVRNEIVEFLWNLRKIINSLDNQERQFTLPLIMDSLKEFHNNVGQLRKLNWDRPLGFSLHLHFQGNSMYHFLHANLDIRRIMIIILNDIEKGGSAADGSFSLDKYLQDVIWDLVGASFIRFSSISLQDYEKVNPFSCTCIQKYWELLIGFIDTRSVQKQTDYFWLMLHNAFKEIQCQESEVVKILTPTLGVVNELGFCWWLLFHLAHLYEKESTSDSLDGISLKQSINASNHFELNNLLKLTISSEIGGYSEIHLRCYLRCCVKLLNMWEPSIEVPSLLWQYFSKRLNESFRLSDDVALPYCHGKSGIHLKNMIEEITGRHGDKPIILNSFHLFLKILSNFLNTPYFKQFGWKEIQLRIASKLQTQLVQTFNSNGLYNCCCLILVLGSSGDLNEAVKIFLDTVAMPIPYVGDGGKTVVVWRTCFALMFFCLEKSLDFVPLEKKMVANMNDLQRELNKSDYKQHPGHWSTELLTVYFESLKDLIENDHYLGLSQCFLLDFDVVDVLARSSESILLIAVTCIQSVVSKLRSLVEESVFSGGKSQYEAIASTLFCIFPWIKKLVCTDSVQSNGLSVIMLSRVALGLTALRYKFSSARTPASETFKAYVNYFCFSQQINHEFVCQYVVLLCEEPSLLIQAGKDMTDFQSQIVRLWFRLGFQMSTASPHYLGFSRSILRLSDIKVLFNEVSMPMPDVHSPKEIFAQLLRVLAAHHSKKLNVIHIRSKVAVYLADLAKIIQAILTSNKQDQVMRIYSTIGEICQHIAALLYISSKQDCLLHQFINLLLLPAAVYDLNTKLSSTVMAALKENLTLFIEGISSLDFIKDPYIGRTLREIFSLYLTRFPLNSSPHEMSMHPLYVSFLNVQLKNPRSTEFLLHVMEALRDQYVIRKAHPQLDICLFFMKEVITRYPTKDRYHVCRLLLPSLLKLMLTSNIKQTVLDLVKLLVNALPKSEDNSIELLHDNVKQIIYEHFKNQQTIPIQIFQLLQSISALFPHTIQRLNLVLGEIISEREKDMCGSDENLRRRYREFLSNHERFSANSNFPKQP